MTYEQIETFLAVITYGTISHAAKNLFVSQSTVSSRILSLEKELGSELLVRSKGIKNVELTPYGSSFVPLARQWDSLWKDTHNLKKQHQYETLTIAGIDSVNNHTLVDLFNDHLLRYPTIKLTINTHHSNEIHTLVENHMADIGFVFSRIHYADIVSRPIYRELMYLVCSKESQYCNDLRCADLDISQEVMLSWGPDFQQWHDEYFPPDQFGTIRVNTGDTLQRFLNTPGRWAIAPMSIIKTFQSTANMTYYKLHDDPPPRICYEITHRYPNPRRMHAMRIFAEELEEHIQKNAAICAFEPWMIPQRE